MGRRATRRQLYVPSTGGGLQPRRRQDRGGHGNLEGCRWASIMVSATPAADLLSLQVFHTIRPIQSVSQIRPCWGQQEITTHRKSMLFYTDTAFAKHEAVKFTEYQFCDRL